ncbi:MAG: DUF411 domain-containing protein [Nanoarchaeota archaeon]
MECCHSGKHGEKGCCEDLKKQGIKMKNNQDNKETGKRFSKVWFLFIGIVAVLALVIFFTRGSSASSFDNINQVSQIDIYKSITCGCCDVYSKYVDGKTNTKVNSFNVQDPEATKRQFGIPSEMESCHTTIIGNYFIEGHVPLEAVEKLLKEQPDIKGIAMPGMPMGSPGMPGSKSGDFIIYAVANDGSYSEFMRI